MCHNEPYLAAIVKRFGTKVPSAFFLADVFAELEALLRTPVLKRPAEPELKKEQIALQEGGKLKKLLSYLMGLYRGSATAAKKPAVARLKQMIASAENAKASSPPPSATPSPLESQDAADAPEMAIVVHCDRDEVASSCLETLMDFFGEPCDWPDEMWPDIAGMLDEIEHTDGGCSPEAVCLARAEDTLRLWEVGGPVAVALASFRRGRGAWRRERAEREGGRERGR